MKIDKIRVNTEIKSKKISISKLSNDACIEKKRIAKLLKCGSATKLDCYKLSAYLEVSFGWLTGLSNNKHLDEKTLDTAKKLILKEVKLKQANLNEKFIAYLNDKLSISYENEIIPFSIQFDNLVIFYLQYIINKLNQK